MEYGHRRVPAADVDTAGWGALTPTTGDPLLLRGDDNNNSKDSKGEEQDEGDPGLNNSIKGWPQAPQQLAGLSWWSILAVILDAVLALCPLAFLVITVLAWRLSGSEISDYGDNVMDALLLAPTIFPILYAAIVGKFMRSCALQYAERGATLGLLEQLNGSTSLASALKGAFMLRSLTVVSVAILLLWAISPLGGQSVLRILSTVPTNVASTNEVFYVPSTALSGLGGASALSSYLPIIDSIYRASILAPVTVKHSPRDLWMHPKVPVFDRLAGSDDRNKSWRRVDYGRKEVDFSSLLGLTVMGLPRKDHSAFSVESSYLDLGCRLVARNISTTQEVFNFMGAALQRNETNLFGALNSQPGNVAFSYSSFFLDTNYDFFRQNQKSRMNVFFGSLSGVTDGETIFESAGVTLFNCTLSRVSVESWVSCEDGECIVERMRRSKRDTRPDYLTPWNNPNEIWNNWVSFNNLITQLPFASGTTRREQATMSENYIAGEDMPFTRKFLQDWSNVTDDQVSVRLTTLFNTYWQSSLDPYATVSSTVFTTPNGTINDIGRIELGPNEMIHLNKTTADRSTDRTVYSASAIWTGLSLAAISVLQLCALASLAIDRWTRAPDILGYISSMTRDNPYMRLPPGGSTLSGIQRAGLLKDLRVRLADVNSADPGHIALVSVDPRVESEHARRVEKSRYYM